MACTISNSQMTDYSSRTTAFTICHTSVFFYFIMLAQFILKQDRLFKNENKQPFSNVNGKATFPTAHVKMRMCVSAKGLHIHPQKDIHKYEKSQTYTHRVQLSSSTSHTAKLKISSHFPGVTKPQRNPPDRRKQEP